MSEGFLVVDRIDGARTIDDYPLLDGDLLTKELDGTWLKESPGLAVGGFRLTPLQERSLKPVEFTRHGLTYYFEKEGTDG